MEEKPLYIPNNFSVRKELWQGFGKGEAITATTASIILMIIAAFLYLCLEVSDIVCLLTVIVGTAIVIAFIQKLDMGLSIIDYYKIQLRYQKEQQKFMYHYVEVKDVF